MALKDLSIADLYAARLYAQEQGRIWKEAVKEHEQNYPYELENVKGQLERWHCIEENADGLLYEKIGMANEDY